MSYADDKNWNDDYAETLHELIEQLCGIEVVQAMLQGRGNVPLSPETFARSKRQAYMGLLNKQYPGINWMSLSMFDRIHQLRKLIKAPGRDSGPKPTARLFPNQSLKSLVDNNQAILSDNEYEVVKTLIAVGGNAVAKGLNKPLGRDIQGTPADHILRQMVKKKGKEWIRDTHIEFPGKGNKSGGGYKCFIEFVDDTLTSPTITSDALDASTSGQHSSEADARS